MAWIELHQSIWTHRKTLLLATELELDEIYAAAHLIHLWTWALDNARDGYLVDLPAKVIAYGAGWKGKPEVFVRALISAGWIDETERGLYIHDWDEYAGRLIEKRRQDAERKRQWRGQIKDVPRTPRGRHAVTPCDGAGTIPNLTIPINDHDDDRARAREEKPNFVATYEQEFGRLISPMEYEKLKAFIDGGMNDEVVSEAIKKTREQGKTNVRYALTILNRWKDQGVINMAGLARADEEFKKHKKEGQLHDRDPTTNSDPLAYKKNSYFRKATGRAGPDL
jgi:DnaD/phage-associated family protein